MAEDIISVSLIHGTPAGGDMEANWTMFERLARRAAKRGADLCVSPETFLDGYGVLHAKWGRRQLQAAGRRTARDYLPRLCALARELQIMLLLGVTFTHGRKCYNSALLAGADGRLIGRYDKTHLHDQDLVYDPGLRLPVFDTHFGPIGIMICADRRWPETARCLRLQGARLILNPTYGVCGLVNEWWMRTRSYENECFICFAHPFVSLVTNPKGDVQAKRRRREPGILTATLDLRQCTTSMLKNRRPGIYGPIVASVRKS